MRLELDDPRLMDYVLGELPDGEALSLAASLELEENKEARELVDELRGVTEITRRILHEEDADAALSDEQRAAIVGTVGGVENVMQGPRRWYSRKWVFSAVAAAAFAVGFAPLYMHTMESQRWANMQMADQIVEDQALLDKAQELREILVDGRKAGGSSTVLTEPLSKEERQKVESEISRDKTQMGQLSSRVEPLEYAIKPEPKPEPKPIRAGVEVHDLVTTYSEKNNYGTEGTEGAATQTTPSGGLSNVEIDSSVRIRENYYDYDDNSPTSGSDYFLNAGEPVKLGTKAKFTDDSSVNNFFTGLDSTGGGDTDGDGLRGNGGFDPRLGVPVAGQLPPQAAPPEDPAIVEARNRLEIKANLGDGLSVTYENRPDRPELTAPKLAEEQWAEYNVGNLTGQTELPEQVASNVGIEPVSPPSQTNNDLLWQWNTPTDKPTEIVGGPGTETYVKVAGVKPFVAVKDEPLSTFSIDVDTAAYSNVRRFLSQGQLPPADAVRIEEMINYFAYSYPQPTDGRPFAVAVHGAPAPWAPERQLVRIGVKGKEVPASERPPANLVFLLDVSGSMGDANKLPLVKESMKTLLSQLRTNDRVGIVTYSGDARLVLGSTPCSEGAAITQAIESLNSGGSTNGGGGIQMAYDLAQSNFIKEGINRVIMATDGDFNVGRTEHGDLMGMIAARAKSGVFLTTLGFGMGNLKDATLEQLADRGNGNYAYIDNHAEARKALVDQLSGTLQTIAKDVKIQVEFNPAKVSYYRLLGYENRALANQDFNDDTKDAGEIGAGHTVTALYEIIPAGGTPVTGVDALKYQSTTPGVDPLKYSNSEAQAPATDAAQPAKPDFGGEERFAPEPMPIPVPAGEWLTVKMRYKQPEGNESTKIEVPLLAMNNDMREADADFRFASAVAAFGQVLRNSGYRHPSNFDRIIEMARGAANGDTDREAFVDLVITAKTLSTQNR